MKNARLTYSFFRFISCIIVSNFCISKICAEEKPSKGLSETRKAILASFKYDEAPQHPELPDLKPQVAELSLTHDTEVIVLETFVVNDRYWNRKLYRDIEKSLEGMESTKRKLGTGISRKDIGKMRVEAVTILYVPIQVGFSW